MRYTDENLPNEPKPGETQEQFMERRRQAHMQRIAAANGVVYDAERDQFLHVMPPLDDFAASAAAAREADAKKRI